ncbi:hypothetical protein AB1Y20_004746 [Prymnesium parvum]|uniref:RING-type domain-containing protein n=1 Tax=Prymnesium parvum TaxID=97485 RepID=A0AB34IXN2_PRYPA
MVECAICFEVLPAESQLPLPCRCPVPYCSHCWDRSLAAAINDSGRARCPTCRCPVRVDFDPQANGLHGRLLFSSDPTDAAAAETRAEFVNRLAAQAAPLMTRLLRAYGDEHPHLRALAHDPRAALGHRSVGELKAMLRSADGSPAGCVEKADLIERLLLQFGGAHELAACCVAAEEREDDPAAVRLHCVCGGMMKRLDGRERCRQLFAGQLEPEVLEQLLDAQMTSAAGSFVVCDLCDKEISPHSPVYTCSNGDSTILHPTTYDVCSACFLHYAIERQGDERLVAERRVGERRR